MLIYLDESGDVGFDFSFPKTSRYFILTALVCKDNKSSSTIGKVVKRTLKNKMKNYPTELKGINTSIHIKKYFLKHMICENGWRIHTAVADKQTWMKNHLSNHKKEINKQFFYDEVARRLFSLIDIPLDAMSLEVVVDRSKNTNDIKIFDNKIIAEFDKKPNKQISMSIKHRASNSDPTLQATDLFCWGIRRKYEYNDIEWYDEYKEKIATEIEYKF